MPFCAALGFKIGNVLTRGMIIPSSTAGVEALDGLICNLALGAEALIPIFEVIGEFIPVP